jgi:predicted MFS family arabinose efflux permease
MSANTPGAGVAGAWAPLRHRNFALLWGAALISNTGTWMHEMAGGWLMTTLDSTPYMVAMVQAANTLPVCLLALPAGTLADRMNRRQLLLLVQWAMLCFAALLGAIVLAGAAGEVSLLLITLGLGACTAVMSPTWQSIVPALVPRAELPQAVALHSVGINISRAIGPAIAGVIIATMGIAWPFLLNALSFVAVILALWYWHEGRGAPVMQHHEPFLAAMRTGVAQVRHNIALRHMLWRSVLFYLAGSCYWALLPLIARSQLRGGPELFGVLVGCIGVGAVAAALWLPKVRARWGLDAIQAAGTVATAIAMLAFALVRHPVLGMLAALLAGTAWLACLSTLNVAAQLAVSDALRARGMALYTAVLFGSLAVGSLIWGQVATYLHVGGALLLAAAMALLGLIPASRLPLRT